MIPPKGAYLNISKLHYILAVANLLVHNNITISYYVQVNSFQLKSSVVLEMGKQTPMGGTIYFAVDGTITGMYYLNLFRHFTPVGQFYLSIKSSTTCGGTGAASVTGSVNANKTPISAFFFLNINLFI